MTAILLGVPRSIRHISLETEWDYVLDQSAHALLWSAIQSIAQSAPLKSLLLVPFIHMVRPPRWESALAEATKIVNAVIGRNVVYMEKQRCEMVGCDEACYSTRR